MSSRHLPLHFPRPEPSPEYRVLVVFGLWLRAGSVGLAVAAIGIIMLTTGEATPWTAVATALCGGAFAGLCWQKARAIVLGIDEAESAAARVVEPAGGVHRASAEARSWR